MTCEGARRFFLDKIRDSLAQQGTPLSGLELEYWQAMVPVGEQGVLELWKDKHRRAELQAIDNRFEQALHHAIQQDLAVNAAARDMYLHALDDIKTLESVQLQAIVFGAATKFRELSPPYPWPGRAALIAAMLLMLGLGLWLGGFLRR